VGAGVMLQFCMPHQLVPWERGQLNANYTMFEATRIPHRWVERSGETDLIVLKSPRERILREFTRAQATRRLITILSEAMPAPGRAGADRRAAP
jgi:hypothetical protein